MSNSFSDDEEYPEYEEDEYERDDDDDETDSREETATTHALNDNNSTQIKQAPIIVQNNNDNTLMLGNNSPENDNGLNIPIGARLKDSNSENNVSIIDDYHDSEDHENTNDKVPHNHAYSSFDLVKIDESEKGSATSVTVKTPTIRPNDHDDNQVIKNDMNNNESFIEDNLNDIDSGSIQETSALSNKAGPIRLYDDTSDSKDKLLEYSARLVQEGERNISLAFELEKVKNELRLMQEETNAAKIMLLDAIKDVSADVTCSNKRQFFNIPLRELIRIYFQDQKDGVTNSSISSSYQSFKVKSKLDLNQEVNKTNSNSSTDHQYTRSSNGSGSASKADESTKQEDKLTLNRLQDKIVKMVERSRHERDARFKLKREISVGNEKIEALSDHIEKLMVHLKYEAITKAKALSEKARSVRHVESLKQKIHILEKRNDRKDKAIADLKEGGKILEDQLRLMDEKYMELRMKLDWTRTQTDRLIKKKEDEVSELRAKFVLVTNVMAEKGKKKSEGVLLDDYKSNSKKDMQHKKHAAMKKLKNALTVGKKLPSTAETFIIK